ncbi:MAG: hypothetical protein GXP42_15935, partial [Chloroflexi bacterium]|nr:hypothetical protein [Chloroflexota bacterium]
VTGRNQPITFSALTNDTDIDGDNINVSSVGDAAHGAVHLQPNQPIPVPDRKITYIPDPNFIGVDGFNYTITDGALSDDGWITVRVVNFDVDNSGVIDIVDVMLVANAWNRRCGDAQYNDAYDFDGDCVIDVMDIMRVVAAWRDAL